MAFNPSRAPHDFVPAGASIDEIIQNDENTLNCYAGCTWEGAANFIENLLGQFLDADAVGGIRKIATHTAPLTYSQCFFDDCPYSMTEDDEGYTIESQDGFRMYIDPNIAHMIRSHHLWDKAVGRDIGYVTGPAEFYEHFMGGLPAPVIGGDASRNAITTEIPVTNPDGPIEPVNDEDIITEPAEPIEPVEPAEPAYEQSPKFRRALGLVDRLQQEHFFGNVYYHNEERNRTENRDAASGVLCSNPGEGQMYVSDDGFIFMDNILSQMQHGGSLTRTISGVPVNKRGYKSAKYGLLASMANISSPIAGDYVGYFFEVEGVSFAVVGKMKADCQFEDNVRTIIEYMRADN